MNASQRLFAAFLFAFLLAYLSSAAQKCNLRQEEFCGVRYDDLGRLKKQMREQFDFLRLSDGDTIVDVGAASGWYEGAVSAGTDLKNLHFYLLDIDTGCLNRRRVDNMISYYARLGGKPIGHGFTLVHNTPDSLLLPNNRYGKVWLLNVLHEVSAPDKLLQQIRDLLRPGGELVLLEFVPMKRGALHGGCKKPLLTEEEWTALMERNGLLRKESIRTVTNNKKHPFQLIRFVRAS